jgi:hypothetical protein
VIVEKWVAEEHIALKYMKVPYVRSGSAHTRKLDYGCCCWPGGSDGVAEIVGKLAPLLRAVAATKTSDARVLIELALDAGTHCAQGIEDPSSVGLAWSAVSPRSPFVLQAERLKFCGDPDRLYSFQILSMRPQESYQ